MGISKFSISPGPAKRLGQVGKAEDSFKFAP